MRQDDNLAERIAEFKGDPEKLRQANEFVDQLLQQAKKEAELKQKQKERSKFESQDTDSAKHNTLSSGTPATFLTEHQEHNAHIAGNLKRRLGRARGLVLRMFDALCNCTQTAAAAARTTARNNPFTKR